MEQADLTVRRIKDGTVIDHIDVGNGLKVLEALRIDGNDGNVITIALNVPSGKLKKKDMIKVEGKFLEDDDTNKLAVIAPTSTVNIIKNYKLVEKRRVSLPNEIDRIFRCSNPECVTNSNEHIESIMDVLDKEKLVLKCRYCNRVLDVKPAKIFLILKCKNVEPTQRGASWKSYNLCTLALQSKMITKKVNFLTPFCENLNRF